MKNTQYRPNKKGFVLSLVLWISASMMLLSLLFVRMNKEESQVYEKMHQKLNVELLTQSLFEKISYYISTGYFKGVTISNTLEKFPPTLRLDSKEFNLTQSNINCKCSLLDHSALFNLRFLSAKQQAQKLIEQLSSTTYSFNDIYLDWIDKDDFTRLNGAERSNYFLDNYKYTPANYISFQHKDSLFLLKGLTNSKKIINENIEKFFTTYGSVPINIQIIDKKVLKSFFSLFDEAQLNELLHLRITNPAEYRSIFQKAYNNSEAYSTFVSKVITIKITCFQNDVYSKLKAIVDFKATNSRSISILEMSK